MPVIALNSAVPPSPDGFYATNNPFQISGPRGFVEYAMLENEEAMFARIDLPGVPEDGIRFEVPMRQDVVIIYAYAPKEHKHDSSPRNYSSLIGFPCSCCRISHIQSHMSNGVLRLRLSKKKIDKIDEGRPCSIRRSWYDPLDPAWTGHVLEPHSELDKGPDMAFEAKQVKNGGLYMRLDMPGVPKDGAKVVVEDGFVKVVGEAPVVSFDYSGRDYVAKVALLSCRRYIPSRRFKTVVKNGVVRFTIPPV